MQACDESQGPGESPQPAAPGHRAGVRQAIRYAFPAILMVVGAGFGAAAIHYRIQERALQKRSAEARSRAQEIGEQIEREAKRRPGEPGLAIADTLMMFGSPDEEKHLDQEQVDRCQKQARGLGIALATACIGLIWLLLMSLSDRSGRWPAATTVALAAPSFLVISASYALILRHRAANWLLFPSCFPTLVGGLLPLFLLRPATVWVGGVKPAKALVLFLIPAAADLIGIALLYNQVKDPMGILLGLSFSQNGLSEDWYLGVALAQWGASIVAFSLAWWFRKRSARGFGSAADGQSA